jgi:hypothetical protein
LASNNKSQTPLTALWKNSSGQSTKEFVQLAKAFPCNVEVSVVFVEAVGSGGWIRNSKSAYASD